MSSADCRRVRETGSFPRIEAADQVRMCRKPARREMLVAIELRETSITLTFAMGRTEEDPMEGRVHLTLIRGKNR
jgi:hypothetical protein